MDNQSTVSLDNLLSFLTMVPAIKSQISSGILEGGFWWIKFRIETEHPLAWQVVQEIGHVVNYLSINERLPTVFYPVSPPPYLNGGPEDFLSWVIESTSINFTPDLLKEWLESRLPNPVGAFESWDIVNC